MLTFQLFVVVNLEVRNIFFCNLHNNSVFIILNRSQKTHKYGQFYTLYMHNYFLKIFYQLYQIFERKTKFKYGLCDSLSIFSPLSLNKWSSGIRKTNQSIGLMFESRDTFINFSPRFHTTIYFLYTIQLLKVTIVTS